MDKNSAKPLFVTELRQERAGDASSGQFRPKSLTIINLRGKRRLARISQNSRKTKQIVAYHACNMSPPRKLRRRELEWITSSKVHGPTAHPTGSPCWCPRSRRR